MLCSTGNVSVQSLFFFVPHFNKNVGRKWIIETDYLMCSMCSENKKFSYGYSSVRGKRASMEDFHDTKISEVNGEMVGLFGVFDG